MSEPANPRCAVCDDALCASEAEFFPYCVPCAWEDPKACLELAVRSSADTQVDELERMFKRKAQDGE